MNCTGCGNPLAPDVRFCTRCGAAANFTQPLFPDRVGRHLQSLGVLWLVYAALRAIKGTLGLAFLEHFFGDHAFGFFPIMPFAGVALGIGVLALLHPIMGTALGIYTLWVLAPDASGVSYDYQTQHRRTI